MDIEKVLEELDALPGGDDLGGTYDFLNDKIGEAMSEGDKASALTLLNEMLGFLRYSGRYDEIDRFADEAKDLCVQMGITEDTAYATTLLNTATALRAAGRYEESLGIYNEVRTLYDKTIDRDNYLYAALDNNLSLLYQAMGDHEKSAACLEEALKIITPIDERRIEQAITRTNLAQAYINLKRYEDAGAELVSAEDIFEKEGGDDFHYPGCLNAIADLKVRRGDAKGAVTYYKKALDLLKRYVGEDNPNYLAVLDNLHLAEEAAADENGSEGSPDSGGSGFISGLELSRRFFDQYGQSMIKERFPGYEDRMTVGLVGRGSQCYGFDDPMSADHDFGPDFCIWLDDDLYNEIGQELQEAYDELPDEFMGYRRVRTIPPDGKRVGVIRTREFFSRILSINEEALMRYVDGTGAGTSETEETSGVLGTSKISEEQKRKLEFDFFMTVAEEDLSQCMNGEIFKEGKGDFARIRERIAYYPDHIWKRKIAQELHFSAQMGQYNYIRMLKRGEKVASEIALSGYMEHTMKLVYLINRTYAPYYKWLHRGMKDLQRAAVIMDIFNAVYDMPKGDERIRMTTEIVAGIIVEELNNIGMAQGIPGQEKFLDVYSRKLLEET